MSFARAIYWMQPLELPELPGAPRQPVIAREDIVLVWSLVLSILIFAGAGFAAWLVVKSGGELIWAGHCRGDRGDCCGMDGGTAGSGVCAQEYQAP